MTSEHRRGSADDLTAELERARDIANAVDTELAAQSAVNDILSPRQRS